MGPFVGCHRRIASSVALLIGIGVVCISCVSVQNFGTRETEGGPDTTADAGAGSTLDPNDSPPATWRWGWANPAPTGNALHAINGTADDDIWVAGAGVIAHYNGQSWDRQRLDTDGTVYFAIGVRAVDDVWVAGGSPDDTRVLHFDGKDWTESYPFAGAAFGGFSHGAGNRLFAIVNLGLLELSPGGIWRTSDTGQALLERGPVSDVWVAPSNDAWAITLGAFQAPTLLHVAPNSPIWERTGPQLPKDTKGLSISGAGAYGCAFYDNQDSNAAGSQDGIGFLFYDKTQWRAGVRADASPIFQPPYGATSGCLRGGSGYIVSDHHILALSLDGRLEEDSSELSVGKRAAWSFDGLHGYVVGDNGLVLQRAWDDDSSFEAWTEVGPTIRNDLRDVDVGVDGTVLAVDGLRTIVPHGGEVLSWADRWKAINDPVAHVGPSVPVRVTVLGESDAWIASDESGHIGVTHFDGAWNAGPSMLDGTAADQEDALAIWAPAPNDVWLTGRERCPDDAADPSKPCSKALASFAAHFDGTAWSTLATEGAYLSIHGTGSNDVWFAGDGVAHWDGRSLTPVSALAGRFSGVWSSVVGRVWLWGDESVLYDGATTTPVEEALNASTEWKVTGIAESTAGDVFVLTERSIGTTLLWFDSSRTKLVEQVSSDLTLNEIRGRGNQLWAIGDGGASLRFGPPTVH